MDNPQEKEGEAHPILYPCFSIPPQGTGDFTSLRLSLAEDFLEIVARRRHGILLREGKTAPRSTKERSVPPGQSLGLDALLIAFNEAGDGQPWYVPTRHLQFVCLDLCLACRSFVTASIIVAADTPHHMWLRQERDRYYQEHSDLRIPQLQVHAITWETSIACISEGSQLLTSLSTETFRERGLFSCEWWPESLRQLTFVSWFNLPIDYVVLPNSLEALTLEGNFNREIDFVVWPASLQQLTFGYWFDQPIGNVVWPEPLRQLCFGDGFNQPIEHVVWPSSLEQLSFGDSFDQPIDGVVWPDTLQVLSFGRDFNHPIDDAVWPDALRELLFGWKFDQPIASVHWTTSLRRISFGVCFNHLIANVKWPDSLEYLEFGEDFNQPINNVAWPDSLKRVAFGDRFNAANL